MWWCWKNTTHSAFYLCGLSRARLSHQHKGLVTHQDVSEALSVLPDRQLQSLLQDLIVAWRVGQAGEGVDLLLNRGLLKEESAACSRDVGRPERLHISVPVTVSIPVTVPVPRPFITVSVPVTPVRGRRTRLRIADKLTSLTYHRDAT